MTSHSLQAVIFDCDGVLVDTEPLHYKAFQEVLAPLGLGHSYDHYLQRYIGFDDRDAFLEAFREAGRPLDDAALARLIRAKEKVLQGIIRQGIASFPGVVTLVRALADHQVPLAVASGALRHEVDAFVEGLGLTGFFAAIIAANDVKRSKPDPETYLKALEQLQQEIGSPVLEPGSCVAIEDTPAGIQSAKGAGLYVVGVCNSFPSAQLSSANHVVASLEELDVAVLSHLVDHSKIITENEPLISLRIVGMRLDSKTTVIACFLMILIGPGPGLARGGDGPSGPPLQPLTLKDAIAYGLAHNRTYLAARQEVDAVNQQVRQARADYYPKVDANYTFRNWKDAPYAAFNDMQFEIAPQSANRWDFQLNQPVFTGFALSSQLNIAKMNFKIAEYRLEETRLNTVRDLERAFWSVLLGQKLLQVARDNVSSLEVQRRNAQANFDQGLVAQNDVLKADVSLAQARQRERSAAKQLTILRSRLNQLLDVDLQKVLTLYEEEVDLKEAPPLERLTSLADERRPEYLSIETSIRQAGEGITAARSRYYPRLSGFAQYYREGDDFFANNNPFANHDNAAVGLRVDWNWFEGGKTDAAEKEYKYRRKALEEQRDALKQQIHLQVEDAYEQLGVARENLLTAEAALKQAEENERMTTIQYREQLVIFLEVLNAQVLLSQSRVDFYDARYGFKLAWADLERAVGGPIEDMISPQSTSGADGHNQKN